MGYVGIVFRVILLFRHVPLRLKNMQHNRNIDGHMNPKRVKGTYLASESLRNEIGRMELITRILCTLSVITTVQGV